MTLNCPYLGCSLECEINTIIKKIHICCSLHLSVFHSLYFIFTFAECWWRKAAWLVQTNVQEPPQDQQERRYQTPKLILKILHALTPALVSVVTWTKNIWWMLWNVQGSCKIILFLFKLLLQILIENWQLVAKLSRFWIQHMHSSI